MTASSAPTPPEIETEQHHTVLLVPDVLAGADFYTMKLGFRLGFTWCEPPTFAGLNLGDAVQIFLSQGEPEPRGCALLYDLAEHKRMSVDGTLEEMLLHSFEPLGEGVASPHTRRTLKHIQELRRRHGIDYDCHASYRFVEKGSGSE